jgi:hypothetical protein
MNLFDDLMNLSEAEITSFIGNLFAALLVIGIIAMIFMFFNKDC